MVQGGRERGGGPRLVLQQPAGCRGMHGGVSPATHVCRCGCRSGMHSRQAVTKWCSRMTPGSEGTASGMKNTCGGAGREWERVGSCGWRPNTKLRAAEPRPPAALVAARCVRHTGGACDPRSEGEGMAAERGARYVLPGCAPLANGAGLPRQAARWRAQPPRQRSRSTHPGHVDQHVAKEKVGHKLRLHMARQSRNGQPPCRASPGRRCSGWCKSGVATWHDSRGLTVVCIASSTAVPCTRNLRHPASNAASPRMGNSRRLTWSWTAGRQGRNQAGSCSRGGGNSAHDFHRAAGQPWAANRMRAHAPNDVRKHCPVNPTH